MWVFGGLVRSSCNILYPRWHHVRCGCALRCAAYNIPVFALVSTCVRTLLPLRAIPWCPYVSPRTHTSLCVACRGAVVLPMQMGVRGRRFSFLRSLLPG